MRTIPPFLTSALLLSSVFSGASSLEALEPNSPVADDGATRFRSANELPSTRGLPDPFLRAEGTRVRSPAEWRRHRRRLVEILEYYQYGHMPPSPGNVKAEEVSSREVLAGLALQKRLIVSCGPNNAVRFRAGLTLPKGEGPFPVIFKNDTSLGPHCPILEELIHKGYIFAEYVCTDLDPDEPAAAGPAQKAYPDDDWGTIAVWAWGGMRLVDYLLTLEGVDRQRIACTGHSRGGKTALLTGAFDERIAMVVPNGSGAGGAGSYRILGEKAESLGAITDPRRFSYWFHPRLRTFAGKEDRLPFDQHFLEALVAPRALLATEAAEDLWANPLGTQLIYLAAKEVYDFLDAGSRIGLHVREGEHDQLVEDWRALLDFAELHFFKRKPPEGRRFDRLPFPAARKTFDWSAPVDRGHLEALGLEYRLRTLEEPRPNRVHILRVDLSSDRIEPAVVIGADPDGDGPAEATLTDPFELAGDRSVLAFINTNPWDSLPDATGKRNRRWFAGQPVDVHSLAVSGGRVRSPGRSDGASVWIDKRGRAALGVVSTGGSIAEGMGGFRAILRKGAVVVPPGGPLHPRTAIGLDRDGIVMWLVVVDGRQEQYSEGMSEHELARVLLDLGCWNAANMDGGGSSIMGLVGAGGRLRVVSSPSDRRLGVARVRPVPMILTIRRKSDTQPPGTGQNSAK